MSRLKKVLCVSVVSGVLLVSSLAMAQVNRMPIQDGYELSEVGLRATFCVGLIDEACSARRQFSGDLRYGNKVAAVLALINVEVIKGMFMEGDCLTQKGAMDLSRDILEMSARLQQARTG